MKESVFIQVTVEVVEEARLALLDFLTGLSPAGIVEESEWEGVRGPACIYLHREGSGERLRLLEHYLDSLRELWGGDAVVSYAAVEVVDPGWATEYRRFFTTQHVTPRITVSPPWETYSGRGDEIVITIEPGPAFGTGTHETTRLCLSALENICTGGKVGGMLDGMLDVGCGSAILSIAGALLGVDRVLGIESDPQAVSSARENVARNGLTDRVTIRGEVFEQSVGTFDLVVANLTTREIEPIIGPLLESVLPGGKLVLSGILDTEEKTMVRTIGARIGPDRPAPDVTRLGEWICLVVEPNPG